MEFMNLSKPLADVYIPDASSIETALSRTTHLGIGAHQDDLEVFAYHGISECYRQLDRWFSGVILTDGAGSSRTGVYANCSNEDMQQIRIGEQRKAAYVGEYSVQLQLLFPSAEIKDAGNLAPAEDLLTILNATKPKVVYLHNPADKHDTHIATLLRCIDALRAMDPADRPEQILGCEVWRDLDWMVDSDKQILPSDKYPNLAAALIGLFDSQITGGKRYDLAVPGRRLANATMFDSHSSDDSSGLTWAMDLKPLIDDPSLDIADFTLSYIDRFRNDVKDRISKFS